MVTVVFLDINGCCIEARGNDAYDLVIDVADGRRSLGKIVGSLPTWY